MAFQAADAHAQGNLQSTGYDRVPTKAASCKYVLYPWACYGGIAILLLGMFYPGAFIAYGGVSMFIIISGGIF